MDQPHAHPPSSQSHSSRRKQKSSGSRRNQGSSMTLYVTDVDAANPVLGRKRRHLSGLQSWMQIAAVKQMLQTKLNIPINQQSLWYDGRELRNNHSLQDCGVFENRDTLQWSFRPTCSADVRMELTDIPCPRELEHLFFQSKRGLLLGKAPQASLDGTGGTYFLPDYSGKLMTAFKPSDEEPFAGSTPDEGGACMRKGVSPGTACYREVLASLMDHQHFSGVPPTTLIKCSHPRFAYPSSSSPFLKIGSLQAFAENCGVIEDYSWTMFPAHELHKIAILDIRTLNCDRNAANILVSSDKKRLIPIDHGFCFPEVLEIGWCDWCWYDAPAAREPFDEESVKFIMSLDPFKDADILRKTKLVSEKAIKLVTWACILLQEGCRAGLTLYDIASLIIRQDLDNEIPSPFEELIQAIEDADPSAAAKHDEAFPLRIINDRKEDVTLAPFSTVIHSTVEYSNPQLESKAMADSMFHGSSPSSVSMLESALALDQQKSATWDATEAIQRLVRSTKPTS